jgi:hypothetical protein
MMVTLAENPDHNPDRVSLAHQPDLFFQGSLSINENHEISAAIENGTPVSRYIPGRNRRI